MRTTRNVIPIRSSIITLIFVLSATLFLMLAALSCSKQDGISTAVAPKDAPPMNSYIAQEAEAPFTDSEMNTEEYGRIAENGFLRVTDNPLSTFAIDVDRASYSNVRRFLDMGRMPVHDAVRIEEMVNYFTYDYPQPSGSDPFSVTTALATCPWNAKNRLLLVGLQGKSIRTDALPPSNLVFLIDVSGSMQSANKLPLLKESLGLLVNNLREQDRVAIVVYAGNAGLVLPSTPGSDKTRILEAINSLDAGGSTAGGEGILLAYKTAKENSSPMATTV